MGCNGAVDVLFGQHRSAVPPDYMTSLKSIAQALWTANGYLCDRFFAQWRCAGGNGNAAVTGFVRAERFAVAGSGRSTSGAVRDGRLSVITVRSCTGVGEA